MIKSNTCSLKKKKSENVDEQKEYKRNPTLSCFSLNPFGFIRILTKPDF